MAGYAHGVEAAVGPPMLDTRVQGFGTAALASDDGPVVLAFGDGSQVLGPIEVAAQIAGGGIEPGADGAVAESFGDAGVVGDPALDEEPVASPASAGVLGIVPEDGIVATFRKLTPGPLRPQDLDLDFTFDVEIAEVTYSPHPETGRPQRPWGALDERTKALVRAVTEYTEGLVAIARQQPHAPDPYFTQS